VIVGALFLCAAAAWYSTLRQAGSMGMGGLAMMGAGLFLVTWLVMMVAMMFPSVAPMTLAFASVTRSRGNGTLPTAAFVLGYLVVWTAAGLVPLGVLLVLNQLWMTPPSWLPRAAGAVVILAGFYQFTPLKDTCLRACRSPLGFILTHDFGGGIPAALRAGASHGLYCLGCCWALMAVLVAVGTMQLWWMIGLAVLIFLEKNARWGLQVARLAAVLLASTGVALLVAPAAIRYLT
jgi:predicted metal-binding membrane protein